MNASCPTDCPVILRLADGVYLPPGGWRAVRVTFSEDVLLETFLRGLPMTLREMGDTSGITGPHVVLARLARKYGGAFAPAIFLPGRGWQGGYFVSVRACSQTGHNPAPGGA
jgi:hypothetical protein